MPLFSAQPTSNGQPGPPFHPAVIVRPATPSDAPAICAIGAGTFRSSFGYSMPEADVDEYLSKTYNESAITAEISAAENHFFVAVLHTPAEADSTDRASVVGFLQMKTGSIEPCIPAEVVSCELHRIYVSKDHLAAGVGGKLIERGVQWAEGYVRGLKKEMGQEGDGRKMAVWLGVWEENVRAQRFYARSGFERVGMHAFKIGGTTQYDHILIKYF